ncbi:hypothetical protein C1H76_5968 [Elsinoe australis]|uniref:Uncharacterized protein n=1 Tax=Elsinoe australis TaxID=40998 RepID=A0A4U7AUP7_9PEZI|nr:hypothetical protein C1H76_5968 [Elsinoe australis]
MAAQSSAARRWIMTLGVTAITVSGAYAGANLAVDTDAKKERRAVLEAGPAEQIKALELRKAKLVSQKGDLEKKLDEIIRRQETKKHESGG